ncbi:MAG: hypothetical protein U9N34_06840, partial [Candidatus Cloacimonadota bacterium]|nr:hypothetical protein [Candidatus Cloacimonadota bacterium]
MKFRFIGILLYISVSLFSFQKIYSPIHKYEKVILNNLQVQLDNKNIIISSEKVILDSIQLEVTRDYVINYKEGRLNLLQEGEVLEIIYQILPKEFAKSHFIFVEQTFQDSIIEKNRIKVHKRSYADSDISISGNKTISLSLASRDNLDFDQSLFLQINGDVSKTVKIEAQLSDSQTPFSP